MDQSSTLINAQIHFLDTELALIHIPLPLYHIFLRPILQLLLPPKSSQIDLGDPNASSSEILRQKRPWAYEHPFVNVSLTPVECSVACSRALADQLFVPVRQGLDEKSRQDVAISRQNYVVIQVDGDGLDAGQRVLELTGPLAMNGISIFFITTYFSDYILVPQRSRAAVITALEARGFRFEQHTEGFVNYASPHKHPSSPTLEDGTRVPSFDSLLDSPGAAAPGSLQPPSTPPPSSLDELQTRTFTLLARRNIHAHVDHSISLVQCAGRKDTLRGGETVAHASGTAATLRLHLGLVRSLVSTPRPRFLSLTLTDTEPASLLLERRLLAEFQDDAAAGADDSVLLGTQGDVLVPVILDLRELPLESTGIVCGVAGRLAGATRGAGSGGSAGGEMDRAGHVEMSYLSTARAGSVMVAVEELQRALDALKGGAAGAPEVGVVSVAEKE